MLLYNFHAEHIVLWFLSNKRRELTEIAYLTSVFTLREIITTSRGIRGKEERYKTSDTCKYYK